MLGLRLSLLGRRHVPPARTAATALLLLAIWLVLDAAILQFILFADLFLFQLIFPLFFSSSARMVW